MITLNKFYYKKCFVFSYSMQNTKHLSVHHYYNVQDLRAHCCICKSHHSAHWPPRRPRPRSKRKHGQLTNHSCGATKYTSIYFETWLLNGRQTRSKKATPKCKYLTSHYGLSSKALDSATKEQLLTSCNTCLTHNSISSESASVTIYKLYLSRLSDDDVFEIMMAVVDKNPKLKLLLVHR